MKLYSAKSRASLASLAGRLAPCALLVSLLVSGAKARAEAYFNPAFLASDPSAQADLSAFEKGNGQLPGTYRVDVYLNNTFVTTRDIDFRTVTAKKNSGQLSACLDRQQLMALNVNLSAFPALKTLADGQCVTLESTIPEASAVFDFGQQRLNISIPQAALNQNARGYIAPDQWDQGINAALFNYTLSGAQTREQTTGNNSQVFLNLQSGLNLGGWRLRDYSTWDDDGEGNKQWSHISTYAEHTLIPLKAELTLGNSTTPGDVFDSLGFTGVQLASDDNMLPDSLKGFAPVVRGIARSNARVTIRQNNYVIYQTYVSAGPFAIKDLYPTASSGDLNVTITESDGSTSSYVVPYSSVPVLQREGRIKYAVTAGAFHGTGDQSSPNFMQGSLLWGLSHGVTVYGGTQLASTYQSLALGVGKNLGDWGAVSTDLTQASSTLADNSQHTGQSVRFLYAKSLNAMGTNFQLEGYRYSTSGFYTLDETADTMMSGGTIPSQETTSNPQNIDAEHTSYQDYYNLYYTRRGKVQLNISQPLNSWGSLYLTASQQSYWHTDKTDKLLQLGYNTTIKNVSLDISFNDSKNAAGGERDQVLALNISIPLASLLPKSTEDDISHNTLYATYGASTDNHGNTVQTAGINGTLLKDNNLNYSLQQSVSPRHENDNGSLSVSYNGSKGTANLGYNYSPDSQQMTYGASGGILIHAHGITFSQPLGDTNILVSAPGAGGVGVENGDGIRTDSRGYAVVPYASTYRQNRVGLDSSTFGNTVDLTNTVVNVVPTQGALVLAAFHPQVGAHALAELSYNGKPVPFGATVSYGLDHHESIVGDNGEVYLSGLPLKGDLQVKWGSDARSQCNVHYQLSRRSLSQEINSIREICHGT